MADSESDNLSTSIQEGRNKRVRSDVDVEGDVEGGRLPREISAREISDVWKHFTKIANSDPPKVECKYCNRHFSGQTRNGTSSLRNHILHTCTAYKEIVNVETSSIRDVVKDGLAGSNKPLTLSQIKECRVRLAKMVILDEQPFSIVEGEGFILFCRYLEPRFTLPSRHTVARDCIRLYELEKSNLKDQMKGERICLTTDCWKSNQNLNYMCLTAHWIDTNWRLRKRILNFKVVSDHKGKTVGKIIDGCLRQWGIEKVLTLTVDNASSNSSMISYLKRICKWKENVLENEHLHVRCAAHILNLVVKDGLKEYSSSIVKIRNAVLYVKSSPLREQSFKEAIEAVGLDGKTGASLSLDVETRWNSTYDMLHKALKFRDVFERLRTDDDEYKNHFKRRTKVGDVRGVEGVTAREVEEIYDYEFESDVQDVEAGAILESERSPTMEDWEVADSFVQFLKTIDGADRSKEMCDHVKATFQKMFVEYEKKLVVNANPPTSSSTSASQHVDDMDEMDLILGGGFYKHLEEEEHDQGKSEVDRYLEEAVVRVPGGENFELLTWWKQNASKYPIVSQIARDVLAIPVSTVSSEQCFSTSGRVIDQYRSRLDPNTVESLICTQNWIRTKMVDLKFLVEEAEKIDLNLAEEENEVRRGGRAKSISPRIDV